MFGPSSEPQLLSVRTKKVSVRPERVGHSSNFTVLYSYLKLFTEIANFYMNEEDALDIDIPIEGQELDQFCVDSIHDFKKTDSGENTAP